MCVVFFKCNSIADHNFQITTFDFKIFKLNAQTCLHIRRNVKLQYTEYDSPLSKPLSFSLFT